MAVLERMRGRKARKQADDVEAGAPISVPAGIEIPENDTFHSYLIGAGGPVDIENLALASPALSEMRDDGVTLVVPLVAQGELLGTLNLGPRMSDQPYSSDDRKLLSSLAAQVGPAVRVAQMVTEQQQHAKRQERIEQELRVASFIQQTLLPKDLPGIPGWNIDAYYQPAREVGGDFYDFITLDDGRLVVVVGDVTDKGVPAALVMATTRATLRATAQSFDDPGRVLSEANDELVAEIPPAMFITCFYGILDPKTGEFVYANAGHNLPYVRTESGVIELRATGMPLGLMQDMEYEVKTRILEPAESMLLTSDGITEAHSPDREMFGTPKLMGLVGGTPGSSLIGMVLSELDSWSAGGEQEDDVTMVLVQRTSSAAKAAGAFSDEDMRTLAAFHLPSEQGNERRAMEEVEKVLETSGLGAKSLERLKTAVSEATMNAIEHGNGTDPDLPVDILVLKGADRVLVRVTDQGGEGEIPDPETPDLEAKLDGLQKPRGWGLFLIEKMVDELNTSTENGHHTVELVMNLQGDA